MMDGKGLFRTQGTCIIAFQVVHNSDFPQPPPVTPRNETSPCYGYGQPHISLNGRYHNHWCTIRARIVLCLYDRFLSVPPRHNRLINESNKDRLIGPLQHAGGSLLLKFHPSSSKRQQEIQERISNFKTSLSLWRNHAVQHQQTAHSTLSFGWRWGKNCLAESSNNLWRVQMEYSLAAVEKCVFQA